MPTSPTYTRSSLGLFSNIGDGLGGGGGGATSPHQRHATTIGTTTPPATAVAARADADDAGDRRADAPERRRASRRQSEDTMRAMRSLDRQYGRRRRLNSDYPRGDSGEQPPQQAAAAGNDGSQRSASNSRGLRQQQPLRRGDSRGLFAPLLCLPQAETVLAVNVSPSYAPPPQPPSQPASASASDAPVVISGGGSARLARQLMLIAGKLAQQGPSALQGPVRPRASMPLINGAHRPLHRNRSQVARRTRDELSDALTMKSVEIRGGRIVLDDPSSSDDSGSDGYASSEYDGAETARVFGRGGGSIASAAVNRRPSAGSSSVCTSAAEAQHWEDDLRRRWFTRRCLAARQPFATMHRLAQAEHDSEAPQPLLNDLRRVLAQTSARMQGDQSLVDVLLCTDAIVVCAPHEALHSQRLRVIEFSDDLSVRLSDHHTVHVSNDEHELSLEFVGSSARPWVESVVQAQERLNAVVQDLRLDEEDYVDRPPPPLLARSSATATTHAEHLTASGVYWVPDCDTHVCMVCHKTAFSMMVRRHHCRACGLIICYRCSTVDKDHRHRMCVRCSAKGGIPKQSPSLHTLGRRAAEYLPSGDLVMQMAAQREAATTAPPPTQSVPLGRRKNDRLIRRPISSLFPAEEQGGEEATAK
ncbi:hypothetical protein GGI21_000085 [Coemansia aciculifera]|nr:hypothetical protein GGI21_000085 [Coemansia aciculifera]